MDGRKGGCEGMDSDGGVETGRGNLEGGNGEREMHSPTQSDLTICLTA